MTTSPSKKPRSLLMAVTGDGSDGVRILRAIVGVLPACAPRTRGYSEDPLAGVLVEFEYDRVVVTATDGRIVCEEVVKLKVDLRVEERMVLAMSCDAIDGLRAMLRFTESSGAGAHVNAHFQPPGGAAKHMLIRPVDDHGGMPLALACIEGRPYPFMREMWVKHTKPDRPGAVVGYSAKLLARVIKLLGHDSILTFEPSRSATLIRRYNDVGGGEGSRERRVLLLPISLPNYDAPAKEKA